MITLKHILIGINLLLITLSVYLGTSVFYTATTAVIPATVSDQGKVDPKSSNEHQETKPLSHFRSISQRKLFGETDGAENEKSAVDIESLKPTALDLKLWGTVAQQEGNADFAVIEDRKTRSQNLYREGDAIQNATVKLILREKVILSVDGKDEILAIEKAKGGTVGKQRTQAARAAGPARGRSRTISIRRSDIERAVKDVNTLLDQVRIQPHYENGKPAGLSIAGLQSGSIIRKMGLRKGDILVGVDGESIESTDDVIKLYERLKSASNVTVQVKRRERLQDFNYRIR